MSGPGGALFRGSITALPTPFIEPAPGDERGRIDHAALRVLIERQIAAGTDGLVLGGSTGEASTLTDRERIGLFELAVGVARGRAPVIAGIGTSDTHRTRALALAAEGAGVAGLLVTTPAYSRPGQEGLRRHMGHVAGSTGLPIVLYNIPSRTSVDLEPETVGRLAAEHPNVVAIKEASDSLERLRILVELGAVDVLCGEDRWIADAMELGAAGVVGVVSNLVPGHVRQLVRAFDDGADRTEAPALVEYLAPLVSILSVETNPAPLKAALELMGLAPGGLRLPLVPVSAENRARIRDVLVSSALTE
jgi:4-hydroxy-tetrahydrodipicolinate synthase